MASFGRPAGSRPFGHLDVNELMIGLLAEDNRVAPIGPTLIEAYGDDFAQAEGRRPFTHVASGVWQSSWRTGRRCRPPCERGIGLRP